VFEGLCYVGRRVRVTPRSTPKLLGRARAALLLCLLVGLVSTVQGQPRGRIVWTESSGGGSFAVKTTVFGPDGNPVRNDEIDAPGATVKVDDKGMIKRQGTPLDASGGGGELHKPELRLLHPALDFTGRRVLFASGTPWGPEQMPSARQAGNAGSLSQVSGGTRIGYRFPDRLLTDPSGATGAANDAFPAGDTQGKAVYFSRFFYGPGQLDLPGWSLMKIDQESIEDPGARSPSVSFVESQSGRVRGSQPFVSPSGEYLLFVRRDFRNVGTDLWYLQLPADEHSPQKLFEGEGVREFTPLEGDRNGANFEAWMEYSQRQSRARISRTRRWIAWRTLR